MREPSEKEQRETIQEIYNSLQFKIGLFLFIGAVFIDLFIGLEFFGMSVGFWMVVSGFGLVFVVVMRKSNKLYKRE